MHINKNQPLSLMRSKVYNNENQKKLKYENIFDKRYLNMNKFQNNSSQNHSPHHFNNINRYYKKQIKNHQIQIQKNPRIKLIQTSRKFVDEKERKLIDRYTKSINRLRILNGSSQKPVNTQNSTNFQSFINLSKQSTIFSSQKRGKSQQSNKIFKGITSRRSSSKNEKKISEFQKWNKSLLLVQNQNQIFQNIRFNQHQSLICSGQFTKPVFLGIINQSMIKNSNKIQRNPQIDQNFSENKDSIILQTLQSPRFNKKESIKINEEFPIKKGVHNQPQVLTIKMNKAQNKFRRSIGFQKDGKSYYQPKTTTFTSLNISQRPNTTNQDKKQDKKTHRTNSQIQPW